MSCLNFDQQYVLDLKEHHFIILKQILKHALSQNYLVLTCYNNFPKACIPVIWAKRFGANFISPQINAKLQTWNVEIISETAFIDGLGKNYILVLAGIEATKLKQLLVDWELINPLIKYVDFDVYLREQKVTRKELGYEAKQCFVCNQVAKICHYNQSHTCAILKQKISDDLGQWILN